MEFTSSGIAYIRIDPPRAEVHAVGEFDIATTPMWSAQLSEAVSAGCRAFHLDLKDITFCDASTIGVIARLQRRLVADEGTVEIVAASSSVHRLLTLVGRTDLLDDPLSRAVVAR